MLAITTKALKYVPNALIFCQRDEILPKSDHTGPYFINSFLFCCRHAQELHVLPKLKECLHRFKTVEDFKVLYTVSLKRF